MKVQCETNWMKRTVSIYFYDDYPNGDFTSYKIVDGYLVGERKEKGSMLPSPTLEIPPEGVAEIVKSLSSFMTPDMAMQNHLNDAILVRDRLLSIIEDNSRRH